MTRSRPPSTLEGRTIQRPRCRDRPTHGRSRRTSCRGRGRETFFLHRRPSDTRNPDACRSGRTPCTSPLRNAAPPTLPLCALVSIHPSRTVVTWSNCVGRPSGNSASTRPTSTHVTLRRLRQGRRNQRAQQRNSQTHLPRSRGGSHRHPMEKGPPRPDRSRKPGPFTLVCISSE
jgi:hypothetical protein